MNDTPVAVVTGGAGHIGAALARRLAGCGARVLLVDRDHDGLAVIVDQLESEGATCIGHRVVDISNESDVAGYVDAARTAWGRIDWFANNAGIEGPAGPIESIDVDMFRRVIDVNVIGVLLGLKHVLPVIRSSGGGAVVNTASVAGLFGTPMTSAYGASKHAVISLTRSAALEHANDGIRINAVCPGPLESRMMRSIEEGVGANDPDAIRKAYYARIPMGRYADVDEVVTTMAWLLAEAPPYLTGQYITVDGGLLIS
jgi:NAD(P)-dependent dehydrogenase (short-subunit alcohol dehydrogenase family)